MQIGSLRCERLRARATKALVTGIALVDAALKVETDPIRARATELVKAKGAHTGIRLL